jgi:hypothetical protein
MLLYLRRGGYAVSLVLVQPGAEDEERASRSDVPMQTVWRERDLEIWR